MHWLSWSGPWDIGLAPLADSAFNTCKSPIKILDHAALGLATLGQPNLGPSDDPDNNVGDLTEAFDYDILRGEKPPIPAVQASIPTNVVATLPHMATANYSPNGYTNGACAAIGILPTDFPSMQAYQAGQPTDPYPVDVNPRPTQSPGTPTSGTWIP